jgi:phosphate-selective porin OprO/OprP
MSSITSIGLCILLQAPANVVMAQTPAPAHPDATLRARLAALEREVQDLRRAIAPAAVADAETSPAPNPLDARLEALDQQIRILARQVELEGERAAEAAKRTPVVDAGRSGFGMRSPDGAYQLRLRGLVQADGRHYGNDDRLLVASTFVARRVRPIVQATLFRIVDARVTPDFGEGRTVVQDAQIDVRFATGFRLRGGKFKSPFGLERLASANDLLFLERAFPTAVAPNRDLGLMVYGDLLRGTTSYSAGVFNGVPDGSSADIDDQDGKDVIGRVFVHPFVASSHDALKGLGFGVAASLGKPEGLAATPNLPVYRTTGQQVFFRYRLDGTPAGTAVADGTRYRASAQGYYYNGPLGLLVEQAYSSQRVTRGALADDVGVNSWQAAGSWVLTGERASYRAVTPKRDVNPAEGNWGAFEIAARYHQLVVDDDAFPAFADPAVAARAARAWTAGLNWYLNPALKLVFDFEQTRFDGGAAGGADRPTANDFFTRLQVAF